MWSIFFSVFPVYATSETVTPLTEDVHGSAAMVETMTTLLQAQATVPTLLWHKSREQSMNIATVPTLLWHKNYEQSMIIATVPSLV